MKKTKENKTPSEVLTESITTAISCYDSQLRSQQIKRGLQLKKTKQNKGLITAGCALAI